MNGLQVSSWDLEPTQQNIALLQQVVKDLETVHSPQTTNTQRLQSQSRLDQVRDDPSSWRLAIALASHRNAFPDPVRHFGISVIESEIKYFWGTYSDSEILAIRQGLLQLCGELDGTNNPPTYLISKLALLFVAILKRTWLASWDDPLPILLELYNRSADSRLLVLQVLRYIVEDVCLSPEEPLPQKRKKLLSQMLTVACNSENTLRETYPDGVEWLETLPGWTKWGVNGQVGLLGIVSTTIIERTTEMLGGATLDTKVIRELLASIKFLQVCIPWGQPRSLVDINLLGLLHQTLLINHNEIRTMVLDTLYVLMTRSIIPVQDAALSRMRRQAFSEHNLQGYGQVLDQVFSNMITSNNGTLGVDRESYGVGKKFVMYICALASSELIPLHCEPVPTLSSFLYLLLRFSTTPSLWISIQTFTIWRNLLLIPTADRLQLPAEQLGTLLSLCIERLVDFEDLLDVPEWSSYSLFLREDFDELEVGSGGLFKNFLAGVKRVLMEIVEGVVSRECPSAIKFMGERLRRFIEIDRLDERDRDERGYCRKTAPAYVQACCVLRGVTATNVGIGLYLENFSGSEDEKNAFREAIRNEMKIWGKMIANTEINDPLIFGRQISAYSALWKYMKDEPEMISMISKAIRGIDLPYPPNATRDQKKSYKSVRARAGQSLIYFSTHCPNAIMSGFDELWTHYQASIQAVETPQKSAWVLLTILFLVNDRAENAGSLEERTQRFDGIVGKVVERWNYGLSQVPGGLDFSGFLKLLGADRVGDYIHRRGLSPDQYNSVLDEEGLALKAQLKQLHRWSWPLREFSSLIDTQQRTPNNKDKSREEWRSHQINRWPTHVQNFVPGLFRIIACLQGFCNSANAAGMPFGLSDIGRMVDMGGWDDAAGNPNQRDSSVKTVKTLIQRLQKNVRNARDHAFAVLGSLSRLGDVFYGVPDIANLLLESLFGEIQGMGILAWRNLIDDAIRPLVINCPQEYWPTFLPALVPPLLMWLVEHTEWDALNQMSSNKNTDSDEETEVSKEAVLRFLFEGMVGLCTDLVSPMTRGDTAIVVNSKEMAFAAREADVRNAALRKKIELRAFVLERQDIMEAYLLLTSNLLKIHDTRAVQHTVRNIQSVLRTLMPSPHYQQFLSNTTLEAALRSYNDSYFAETQSELLDLIAQIYTADPSGQAKSLFLRLPGVKESSLTTYEQNLSEHKSSRSRRQFTKELLAEIKGLATSEQGRKQVDLGPDTSARSMMQKLAAEAAAKAKKDKGDLLSRDEETSAKAEEGAVLHLLFGNDAH